VRRRVAAVVSLIVLAGGLFFLLRGEKKAPASGANLLLITLDTFRADRLGANDNGQSLTPNLDALAASGLSFEEALTSVPLTLPSHSTILSGLEPPRHGVHDNGASVFPREPPTLATLLKARGYATGAFVGAYVLDRRFGLARGFDVYDDRIEGPPEGASELESERPCEVVIAAAREWMSHQIGTAFVAWVHLYDAHAPYAPPSPFAEAHLGRPYDGEVAHVDSCVGSLLEAARAASRSPLLTAVVGDHGEALGEHDELTHGFFVYQSTLRIPFVLAGPGIPKGERRPGPARTADLLPTLLGRLGVAAPAGLDGIDLFAHPLAGESYAESLYPRQFGWAPLRSFRLGTFKLIDAPRPELYDLAHDPGEQNDLFTKESDRARRLREALQAFRANERAASATAVGPEVAERLKALGYVAASAPAGADEKGPDPKDRLSDYRSFEEAAWAAARGEHDVAIARLDPLVVREPGNPVYVRSLAASLRRVGRRSEAAALLSRLVEGGSTDAVAWHERAIALKQSGRIDGAIASEERAIQLNPLLPEPLSHLGMLEAGRGHLARALEVLDAAVALDPNNAKAWNNRGNVLRALGRGEEAAVAFRKAAELRPNDPDPVNGLGVLLVQSGRAGEAATLFRRALDLAPHFAEARLNLAVAEAQQGQFAEARGELKRLLAEPAEADVRHRGEALLRDLPASR
jgi:arylsulfatase A-like enzyme